LEVPVLIRALSALVGVGTLFTVWWLFSVSGLLFLCALVTLIACTEFSRLVEKDKTLIQALFVVIAFASFLTFSFYSQSILVFISFFILLVTYFMLFTQLTIERRVMGLSSWTMGILYCGVFTGIVTLGVRHFGSNYFVALLLVSFLTDTFAYLGGRLIGKRPLAPAISPKKTIEGSFIGLLGGAGAATYYLSQLPNKSPIIIIVITALSASLFSQVGDLFESMIKRYSGVKDSGRILPGHGGILDRIDGVLFAGPIIYLWMDLFLLT
jgi:phosphatidate cytidylyltransferase